MSKYFVYYVLIYGGLGAYTPYIVTYLEKTLGLSATQIGIITSIPSIIGILVVPMWGMLADVSKKDKTILGICISASCIIMGIYLNTKLFAILLLVATLLEAFRYAISPLADNITTDYCKEKNLNYGLIRSGGSVGFALVSLLTGQLIRITSSNKIIFYVFIGLLLMSLCMLPFLNPKNRESQESNIDGLSTLKLGVVQLLKNKSYIWMLVIVVSTLAISEVSSAYQGMYLMELGGLESDIGILVIFTSLPEILFMLKVNSLVERFGYKKVFAFGVSTFLLRWITCILSTSPKMFILTSPLCALAFSIILVAYIGYIKDTLPSDVQATALTITSMVIGISAAIIKLPVGLGIDMFGLKVVYMVCIAITGVGLITCLSKKESEQCEIKISS